MNKILKLVILCILSLILCTSSVSAFRFDGNHEYPAFYVDDVLYVHDYGSTDVELEGRCLKNNLKILNIPETVVDESDGQVYTVTNVFFDDYIDGFPECVYTIETINISKNLKNFDTSSVYRSLPGAWKNLKTINIPDDSNLEYIGIFEKCPNLKTVNIPKSVKLVEFGYCPNLKMTVSKGNKKYKMREKRYLCSKDGKIVYNYFGTQKRVTIPNGIKNLDGFSSNKYVEKIIIPSSVKKISYYAFGDCKRISKITIKSNKKSPKFIKNAFKKTKKGIKFVVKNKKVAKSLNKKLKGSGVRNAKILIGKKVVYKNING